MTQDEIIYIGRKSGLKVGPSLHGFDEVWGTVEDLERFARLVAKHEREACAKIADEYVGQDLEHNFSALVAHNIRARGQE